MCWTEKKCINQLNIPQLSVMRWPHAVPTEKCNLLNLIQNKYKFARPTYYKIKVNLVVGGSTECPHLYHTVITYQYYLYQLLFLWQCFLDFLNVVSRNNSSRTRKEHAYYYVKIDLIDRLLFFLSCFKTLFFESLGTRARFFWACFLSTNYCLLRFLICIYFLVEFSEFFRFLWRFILNFLVKYDTGVVPSGTFCDF